MFLRAKDDILECHLSEAVVVISLARSQHIHYKIYKSENLHQITGEASPSVPP